MIKPVTLVETGHFFLLIPSYLMLSSHLNGKQSDLSSFSTLHRLNRKTTEKEKSALKVKKSTKR